MMKTSFLNLAAMLLMPLVSLHAAEEVNLARGKVCETFSSLEDKNWGMARLTDGETGPGGWRSKAFAKHGEHRL